MNSTIIDNINAVRRRIKESCQNNGRDPQEVKLLLATKTVTAE